MFFPIWQNSIQRRMLCISYTDKGTTVSVQNELNNQKQLSVIIRRTLQDFLDTEIQNPIWKI